MSSGRERLSRGSSKWTQSTKDRSVPSRVLSGTAVTSRDFTDDSGARLARTIQAEIVPRLMLAHRDGTESPNGEAAYAATPPSIEDVSELARLIIAHDADLGRDYIEAMQMKGMSVESVFIDLLTPAARLLGALWADDRCTFTDVTIGLSRLQGLVDRLASAFCRESDTALLPGPRAALIEIPGEQHTFGLHLVREFFRREGWDVWGASSSHPRELVNLVQDEWVSLVGLTMSSAGTIDVASNMITEVRSASLNPNVFVLIGGPCVIEDPAIAQRVGADAAPADAREALKVARSHYDQMGSSRERH